MPCVPDTEVTSTYSVPESIKKHKRHDKSKKKHKKHKKKSKKSKKKKRHSRSNSPDDCIELKLKKDKLEEAKSGMSVSLDVIMETIVSTANEKSEEVKDIKYNENEIGHLDTTNLIDTNRVQTPENDSNQIKHNTTGLNNGKIIIKDLKKSRLYHELVLEVQEKERLKTEKCKNSESSSLDKKKKKEKHKSKKKKRSRSRNRSSTPKRFKKYSRSRSNSKDKYLRHDDFKSHQTNSRNQIDSNIKCKNNDSDIKSKEKSNHHKRSITPDKYSKSIRRSRSRDSKKSKRSEDYYRTRKKSRSRETSRSRHRSPSCEKIDKKKLFKIARKNALSLVQQGVLPVGSVKKDTLANVPTKTVDELTDFCRKLAKKDKDHDDDTSYSSDDDEFKQPFHHPFLVKERPNIVMNIRNATQLPIKSFQEKTIGQDILRQQFPVSSGQTHSLALTEWMPIGPEESAKLNKILRPDEGNKLSNKSHHIQQAPKVVPVEPVIQPVSSPTNAIVPMDFQYVSPAVETPAFIPYAHGNYSLLSFETGQFTGHTGAKVLTPAELSAGFQTWVKKVKCIGTLYSDFFLFIFF
uniref:Protein SON n=1 Tax=Schizaphis graminum TaxID=13262 RepID=A0A2S2N8U7_SCHGA